MMASHRVFAFLVCLAVLSLQLYIILTWRRCEPLARPSRKPFQVSLGAEDKPRRLLVVGILSKITAFDRRDAIRSTWMNVCRARKKEVVCLFFTDPIDSVEAAVQERTVDEMFAYNDVLLMPYKGGYNFSKRLIWMMSWFSNHYEYEFFLRIDDDYFLCLDALLDELPFRPKNGLYWGFLHCRQRVVRIDEGWMILSSDIIQEALAKLNSTLPCHPFGDQAVALWIQESELNITYFADPRIEHSASGYDIHRYLGPSICRSYLGLHGSYPLTMLKYWISIQRAEKMSHMTLRTSGRHQRIPNILPYEQVCQFNKTFDVNSFYPHVRFDPKPCKDDPVWSISHQSFVGREQEKNQIF